MVLISTAFFKMDLVIFWYFVALETFSEGFDISSSNPTAKKNQEDVGELSFGGVSL